MFLDDKIINDFRNEFNKINFFIVNKQFNDMFDFCCAFMDRIQSAIEYVNANYNNINNEVEFITYIVYLSIIRESIIKLTKKLNFKIKGSHLKYNSVYDSNDIFGDIFKNSPLGQKYENTPNDEDFFDYIRAITYAHPIDTTRMTFLNKEENYSPYLDYFKENNTVRIRIYNNVVKETKFLYIDVPLNSINEFIVKTYNRICDLKEIIKDLNEKQIEEWRKFRIDDKLSNNEKLELLIEECQNRNFEFYELLYMKDYINIEITNPKYKLIINKYKKLLENNVNKICKLFQNEKYEEMYDILYKIIDVRVDNKDYQYAYSKIYTNLKYNDNIYNYNFAKDQAREILIKLGFEYDNDLESNQLTMLVSAVSYECNTCFNKDN